MEGAWSMKRKAIMRELRKLASSKCNDAVKLAYLTGEDVEKIDGLDLSGLAELKRSGNGGVELKLVDRVRVLELLDELSQREEGTLENFLNDVRQGENE